jgi:hypothetical protein
MATCVFKLIKLFLQTIVLGVGLVVSFYSATLFFDLINWP